MLLRHAGRRLGMTRALNSVPHSPRSSHRRPDLFRWRVYGLALGYEDLNGYDTLRHDLVW